MNNHTDKELSSDREISAFGITDKGIKRDHNEDSFYLNENQGIFIVADGVGGHQAGEIASKTAVNILTGYITDLKSRIEKLSWTEIEKEVKGFISRLNKEVYKKSLEKKEYNGMGCTIVSAFIDQKHIYIFNVGDSRAYLLRENMFKQITIDHSLVGNLVLIGQLKPSDARKHPMKHIISRHIGMEEEVLPDIYKLPFRRGDRVLLTTDGLTDMVTDKAICSMLAKNRDIEYIVTNLMNRANNNGGEDNITIIVIQKGKFNADIYRKKPKIRLKYRQIKTEKY